MFFWINQFAYVRGEADGDKDVEIINWISVVADTDTVALIISDVMFYICSRIMHALLHVDYIYTTLIGLCLKMTTSGALR